MWFLNKISRVKTIPKTSHIPGDLYLLMRQVMQDGNWDDCHEGVIKTPFSITMDVFIILTLCC
jgi:hypothetical protein